MAVDETLPKAHFLALAGELRNQIYNYCHESERVSIRTSRGKDAINDKSSSSRPSFGSFGSLVHTCRQLREEYLPLYLSPTTFILTPRDVELYIKTFYPALEKAMAQSKIKENSLIYTVSDPVDLSQLKANIEIKAYEGFEIDLTLLLNLICRAPNFGCRFTNLPQAVEKLNHVLKKASTSKNRFELLKTVEKVDLCHTFTVAYLSVHVRGNLTRADTSPSPQRQATYSTVSLVVGWLQEVGLLDMLQIESRIISNGKLWLTVEHNDCTIDWEEFFASSRSQIGENIEGTDFN